MPSAQIDLSRAPCLQLEERAVDELAKIAALSDRGTSLRVRDTAIPAAVDALRKSATSRAMYLLANVRPVQPIHSVWADGHLSQRYGMCGVD